MCSKVFDLETPNENPIQRIASRVMRNHKRAMKAWETRRKRMAIPRTLTKDERLSLATAHHNDVSHHQVARVSDLEWHMLTREEQAQAKHKIFSAGAKKAWATKRARMGHNYDAPKKNNWRDVVIESLKETKGDILALESKDFLFANRLAGRKIRVYENDPNVFREMAKNHPCYVTIIPDDVVLVSTTSKPVFGAAFLDFCKPFRAHQYDLMKMKDRLASCEKIAVAFSLRDKGWDFKASRKENGGDYRFELTARLLSIFDNYTVEYGTSYRDSMSMVGIILIRKDLVMKSKYKYIITIENRREKLMKEYTLTNIEAVEQIRSILESDDVDSAGRMEVCRTGLDAKENSSLPASTAVKVGISSRPPPSNSATHHLTPTCKHCHHFVVQMTRSGRYHSKGEWRHYYENYGKCKQSRPQGGPHTCDCKKAELNGVKI
jgi:hypothetical protein